MDASSLAMLLLFVALFVFGVLFFAAVAPYLPPRGSLFDAALIPWYEGTANLASGIAFVMTLKLSDAGLPRTHPWIFNWIEIAALCVVVPLYLRYSTAARLRHTKVR